MPRYSKKSITEFIEMYKMQDVLSVENDEYGCQVYHRINEDDTDCYECKTITDAAHCVNSIIFDLPDHMGCITPSG